MKLGSVTVLLAACALAIGCGSVDSAITGSALAAGECTRYEIEKLSGQEAETLDSLDNVEEGDRVRINYEVSAACASGELTFVSYTAAGSEFNEEEASLQRIYDAKTVEVNGGDSGSLTIEVPPCFFQVDFVTGQPIEELRAPEQLYASQGRLIEAGNGGDKACEACQLASTEPVRRHLKIERDPSTGALSDVDHHYVPVSSPECRTQPCRGYNPEGIAYAMPRNGDPDAVPFWRWLAIEKAPTKRANHFFTRFAGRACRNVPENARIGHPSCAPEVIAPDFEWSLEGAMRILPTQRKGTVELWRWFDQPNHNHFYTTAAGPDCASIPPSQRTANTPECGGEEMAIFDFGSERPSVAGYVYPPTVEAYQVGGVCPRYKNDPKKVVLH